MKMCVSGIYMKATTWVLPSSTKAVTIAAIFVQETPIYTPYDVPHGKNKAQLMNRRK